jgi:hypothetical protein
MSRTKSLLRPRRVMMNLTMAELVVYPCFADWETTLLDLEPGDECIEDALVGAFPADDYDEFYAHYSSQKPLQTCC